MAACDFKTPEEFVLQAINFNQLPGWGRDDHLTALKLYAPDTLVTTDNAARWYFEQNFTPFKVNDNQIGLFTGYYEPVLNGSRHASAKYNVPIYCRPPELILIENLGIFRPDLAGLRLGGTIKDGTLLPYYTRGEIMAGVLQGRGLELVWVDSAVDAFFMAVQGSGYINFEDGSTVKLAYDGANGYPYTTIGKVLLPYLKDAITMQSIKDWLQANPDKTDEILAKNKSYIFFKEISDCGTATIGSCGLALTPQRSMAVDKRYIDLGTLLWLDIPHPDGGQLQQLIIAQDSGSAIKGTVRGDYYWGTGPAAGQMAGKMKSRGNFYILKSRTDV